jgi:hypothetical protein
VVDFASYHNINNNGDFRTMICTESVYWLFGIWAALHLIVHAVSFSIFKTEKQYHTIAVMYAFDVIYMSLWIVILNYFSHKCVINDITIICEKQVYVLFIILFLLHTILYAIGWALFKMEEQLTIVGVLIAFDIAFLICFKLLLNLFSGVCPV